MNNILLYCGLLDSGISASEKDLPVLKNVQEQLNAGKYWQSDEQHKIF